MSRNIFRYDPVIGYRFVPNLKGRVRHEGGGYLVRANASGFRNDIEFKAAPTEGKTRVMVFGDSNTAGDGVSNGKRFSDVIGQRDPSLEIYNFGLPSSGTDQQYLAFREVAADLHYDALLICPMVDNIRRNLQSARMIHSGMQGEMAMLPKPYFELENSELILRNSPVPKGTEEIQEEPQEEPSALRTLARQAMERADKSLPGLRDWSKKLRRIQLPEAYNSPDHPGWLLMRAILLRWISEAKAPVILCPIPTFEHIFDTIGSQPFRDRFSELSAETGVPFIDLMPEFRKIDMETRRAMCFPTDDHPTVAGHEAFADLILPHLQAHLKAGGQTQTRVSAE